VSKLIDFPFQNGAMYGLALICHFLVSDSRVKVVAPIYGSHPIGLLYFIELWTGWFRAKIGGILAQFLASICHFLVSKTPWAQFMAFSQP
jgi:hypothetical protein